MIVALSGGVGGARLCAGLLRVFEPSRLSVVVNTGDDFEHWGLKICPDLDTVMYTLAGRVDESQGWGLAGETWNTLDAVAQLGGPAWFRLGDQDLATHLARTSMLKAGRSLSEVTQALCGANRIAHPVLPATDEVHASLIDTDEGTLAFQDYFVRLQCKPRFRGIRFSGAEGKPAGKPAPSPGLAALMQSADVEAVVICPSNPVLSVLPILEVDGVRDWLRARRFPVLAVSPFIAGRAVKGPAAAIFEQLGLAASTDGLNTWYDGLVDGWLVDPADPVSASCGDVELRPHNILLSNAEMRVDVAQAVKRWIDALS